MAQLIINENKYNLFRGQRPVNPDPSSNNTWDRLNHNFNELYVIKSQISASLTDSTPSKAEISAATGLTPSTVGAGWQCTIADSSGTGLLYRIESDGTDWWYTVMTKAT